LSQALMNLCTNARDAMPDGGQLCIEAKQVGNHAELIVSDTGQGMKRKTIEQCFDPFFTTKPIGKGTGLGLSTTYGIVKSHEGLIHMESKPKKGTTITMTFPLAETGAAVEKKPEPAAEISYGNGEIILVVDDEEEILKAMQNLLKGLGYQSAIASSGKDAIEKFEAMKPEVVLMDINMPEMDGLELAEHIRMKDNSIPVVVMTGYPSMENTIKTLKNGVVDFLIKPVSLNQMELCLKRVFREQQLFVENILLKKEVESKERLEKLNTELLGKVDELNTLNKIMSDFTAISTSMSVFKRAVDLALEITGADDTRFYVINEAVQRPFEVAAAYGDRSPLDTATAGNRSIETLIMETVTDEIPLLISQNNGARGLSLEIRSLMVVPLKIR
ncbi:MAG: response regulator, partial [Desulfobacterales bacterium]|nr:response regulator [Desulfobacterales bacterium]